MAARCDHLNAVQALQRDPPAYEMIAQALRRGIRRRSLPPGLVLQEETLASLFGSSRSPVKAALRQLIAERLVSRADGRRVLVGSPRAEPNHTPLTHAMLGLEGTEPALPRVQAWRKIYGALERELIHRSVFGRFQVNELELARHYGVGRTVAHEALLRLQSNGIVSRGERARWYVVPLDSKRLGELYGLRKLLEPALAGEAATRIPPELLERMRNRLDAALRRHPDVPIEELDALEHDLHVSCLEFGGNREMLEALTRTRCILVSGKHILGKQTPSPRPDPFLAEHRAVIEALLSRDPARARAAMGAHLDAAHRKVEARHAAFRDSHTLSPLSFVTAE